MCRQSRLGMTLIEVMIVIAILGVLMAILGGSLLNALDDDLVEGEELILLHQEAPSADLIGEVDGQTPNFTRSVIEVTLLTRPVLDGITARTRFSAEYLGAFTIEGASGRPETVKLFFPFPPDVSEVQDVEQVELDPTCRLIALRGDRPSTLTPIIDPDAAVWLRRFLADRLTR